MYVSVISVGELYTWAYRSSAGKRRLAGLLGMLADVVVLDVDHEVAKRFGQTRAALLDGGRPVAIPDLLLASTALVHDLTVATHNVSHFQVVPGLRVLDWLAAP